MEELIVFLHVMNKTKIYHLEQHRKKPKNKSNKMLQNKPPNSKKNSREDQNKGLYHVHGLKDSTS